MHIHGRTKALIGVLAATFVAVLPGTAFAGHDLGIYKVEKQVDLESDETQVDLSCGHGDYALDGMWRIDHADQDDDDLFISALGRSVDVGYMYPFAGAVGNPGGHLDGYHYIFYKNAIGRVQLKVFLTCLKDKTEVDGHQHQIEVDNYSSTGDIDGAKTTPACPANQFVATPGFKINDGALPADRPTPYLGHLYASYPSAINQYSWGIDISQAGGSTVDFYWSCVHRKVPQAGGEKHKLVYRRQGGTTPGLPANKVTTRRIECKSHYKAVVAGFWFQGYSSDFGPPSPTGGDPNPDFWGYKLSRWWWLGMDPQPKNRDFKFLNADTNPIFNTELWAICLNYRTT